MGRSCARPVGGVCLPLCAGVGFGLRLTAAGNGADKPEPDQYAQDGVYITLETFTSGFYFCNCNSSLAFLGQVHRMLTIVVVVVVVGACLPTYYQHSTRLIYLLLNNVLSSLDTDGYGLANAITTIGYLVKRYI